MFLSFPDFNIYSTPLLVLVVQGLILIGLLFSRFAKTKMSSDLILGLLLLLLCYQQICYTIGFMGWYNEFRNTKINYFLIPIALGVAPLIYFYVKSVTSSRFTFRKRDWWHFVPIFSLVAFRLVIFAYDASQPGFSETQNGYLKIHADEAIVQPLLIFVSFAQTLLYLAFTFQLYINYRKKIQQYFSNIYKLELNWIRNFLVVFSTLFLYGALQDIISSLIVDLSYTQQWWLNLFMGIVVLYVGIYGYFTETTKLKKIGFGFSPEPVDILEAEDRLKTIPEEEIESLKQFMDDEKPFLDPELNLSDLSKKVKMSRGQLSAVINNGFKMNFNDFVNSYRVKSFQDKVKAGEHQKHSLLGIAYDCGFNSKATFNRVFRKLTEQSPSDYANSI
ncbi:MAG: AraC family transcriptional regulator [Flavobacteriaceae bacterium]|nr:helix-turn-helix domain-containing protein [Bacteroidia bacterium]NNK87088.1 AraC family transcriptional regulator [Flavobacteriaceae bacterium]